MVPRSRQLSLLARVCASIATVLVAVALLPASAAAARPSAVDRLLARMTLEEKVGQLFTGFVYGTSATAVAASDAAENRALYGVDTPAQVVAKFHLGGVIYFSWSHNLNAPDQIAGLSNGLQTAARSSGAGVPLVISTDQEQGVIVRMPAPAAQFPGGMALGAGRSLVDAFRAAQVTGQELRAVGIDQPFAPDADVNVNPANPVIGVRSYGSDPTLVAAMTAAQVAGFQLGAGASPAAKHFPGHGDTATDSHTGLPVITHDRATWERLDAPPFKAAIAAGIDTIMTAHIVVPALDPSGDPATLSRPILTGLLREKLRFNGVVVTDSLQMTGVRQKYGDDRVPVLALKAGADMLLMPPKPELAVTSVLAAVAAGELTEARIDQSVRRILTLKQRRGVLTRPDADPAAALRTVGSAAHQRAVQDVTDRSTTVVSNDSTLPLAGGRSILVTGWDSGTFHNVGALAERLAARGATTTALPTGLPSAATIARAVTAAGSNDLTVVMTQKAWDTSVTDPNGTQRKLVDALLAAGRPVVVVAVRDPTDLGYFPGAAAKLATYTYTPAAMESLAGVLSGDKAPRGRLPVDVPSPDGTATQYPYGHGITWRVPR